MRILALIAGIVVEGRDHIDGEFVVATHELVVEQLANAKSCPEASWRIFRFDDHGLENQPLQLLADLGRVELNGT